ncbi:uncharacterized protein LOC131967743 [Centropristis striata]|uniref:uncharacterized protein LOC131967743 n=1 Tax=Centropristis striata TaxID=184440 RepID=UPI0027E1A277|nr:uncharacterized protein LOC131967743 [Centropristis striata]
MHDISAYCACQLKPKKYLLLHSVLVWVRPPPGMQRTTCSTLHTVFIHHRQWTMMAAVSTQGLGGRKRRDDIWVYFKYYPAENKMECIVKEDGDKCGHKVGGKNTTNLKQHLKARHKDIFSKIPENSTPKEKPGGPKNNRAQSSIPVAFAAASKYKSGSLEQGAKEQAIALWIGRTGLPACTVEDEEGQVEHMCSSSITHILDMCMFIVL